MHCNQSDTKKFNEKPPKSIAQNLTFKIPPHQIHHFARASSNPAVFGGYQVSWRKMKNSPGNRTWKLRCLQVLRMKIHHLELQNNKNAQWQMKSKYFHRTWDEKVIVFFCLFSVLFGFRSQKNLRRKSTKRTGGQLGIIWFGFEPFSPNTGIKNNIFTSVTCRPSNGMAFSGSTVPVGTPLPFRSSPLGV